jgi:hypothetical protein
MSPGRVDLVHDNLYLADDSSQYCPSRAVGQGFGPLSGPVRAMYSHAGRGTCTSATEFTES